MTRQGRNKTQEFARPIKTRRDFESVVAIVKRPTDKSEQDVAPELRLQLMLKELDKFDQMEDEAETDVSVDDYYIGPGRRWSDETSEQE